MCAKETVSLTVQTEDMLASCHFARSCYKKTHHQKPSLSACSLVDVCGEDGDVITDMRMSDGFINNEDV
jgi:hypothetical protein